ncbi:phage tail protein [Leclercia adecarboxylata]|uniref:phage tail protein n=1 Tax=Leclercia adecarboxylata TaxID=83655 RepID=UPI00301A49E8
MAEFPRASNGRYQTEGLSSKEFERLFSQIERDKRSKRRQARRTLTPLTLKNKNADDIIALGKKKKDGTFFTADDLQQFAKNRKFLRQQLNSGVAGITYAQLVAASLDIDIKRANNKVDDGSGIKRATPSTLKHNEITISVEASERSEDQHHRVKVRFEEWDQLIDDLSDEKNATRVAKRLCAGRVSFDCDCGRHQYWYRYIATAGNFALAPPKEYAYPKIKNPNLSGLACKHVIHAMTRLQSSSWQMSIGKAMLKAASLVAFGDDRRRTTQHFTDEDRKQFGRNRNAQTNKAAASAEYERYQKRQLALGKQIGRDTKKLEQLSKQLVKARKQSATQRARSAEKEAKLKQEKEKNKLLQQQLADQFKVQKQAFTDALIATGISRKEADKRFMDYVKNKGTTS